MKRVSIRGFFAIILIGFYILSSTWYSWSFKGRIVDELGQPIARAVVGVGWVVTFFNRTSLVFKEVVTDEKGVFEIPGWIRVTPWPLFRMVGSPYLYVVKRGYRPLSLQSGWVSYSRDATPEFKQPVKIHKVDLRNFEEEYKHIHYLVSDICGGMNLISGRNILAEAKIIKEEIRNLSSALPKRVNDEYLGSMTCL